ncbi:MAG: hypothetical protein A3E78_12170 [Alphaproteobacteria bacterium RIFCSPHIGHO2_12_FULL_63_12]|nr:MAG: hypothetical protein A3E78_12170 [Alphaproteobacteria bacterium RIFCSPHIGHO2_12_FULL_63_12]
MPFTANELASISNGVLDFHIRGQAMSQTIQDRPLLDAMLKNQKTFGTSKEFITGPVKGDPTTTIMGYTHDDVVSYANPANLKRWSYKWYEIHAGISLTGTELKQSGISVVDSTTGAKTSQHSDSEMALLVNLLDDKVDDMMDGWARGMNNMFWRDGSQDAKVSPGILAFILDAPTVGVTGGLDRAQNTWWRNRAALAVASNSSTWSAQPLARKLQQEFRQVRRFGGKPKFFPAGSDFLDALEMELRTNGTFTQDGWNKSGKIDLSVSDMSFKGVNLFYDPTLDDLGLAKYAYLLDLKNIKPYVMEGEDRKMHTPARPADQYVYYRAMTWTGGMVVDKLNSNEVFSIA